jgi:hypothetical protein
VIGHQGLPGYGKNKNSCLYQELMQGHPTTTIHYTE